MSATALNRFDPELRHLHAPLPGIPDEFDRPPVAPRPIEIRFGRDESDMKEAADKVSLAVLSPRAPAAASGASNNSVKSTLKGLIEEGILFCLELQKPGCANREELLRRLAADAEAMDREVTAYLDLCKSASLKTSLSASSTSTPYYTLVHELRTPLQSLLGMLSFDDRSAAYFLDLHKIYKELDWLADQIAAFLRRQAGRLAASAFSSDILSSSPNSFFTAIITVSFPPGMATSMTSACDSSAVSRVSAGVSDEQP